MATHGTDVAFVQGHSAAYSAAGAGAWALAKVIVAKAKSTATLKQNNFFIIIGNPRIMEGLGEIYGIL